MLRIDRVTTQLEALPSTSTPGQGATPPDAAAVFANPQAREHVKELVREALREQLRELERQGVV